jgi:histidinol-phosphate/aromatic aminotransferase/cobyric acid decarboxylase-like protein
VHAGLRAAGFAVRRCDTFPGLGPDWVRVAVRDRHVHERLAAALAAVLVAGDR